MAQNGVTGIPAIGLAQTRRGSLRPKSSPQTRGIAWSHGGDVYFRASPCFVQPGASGWLRLAATHRRRCERDCIPEWRCFLHSCMLAHEMPGAVRDSLGSTCSHGVCLHIPPPPNGDEVMTPTRRAISSDFRRRPRPHEPAVISTQGTPFRLARCKQAPAKSPRKSPAKSHPAPPPMIHPDLSQPT